MAKPFDATTKHLIEMNPGDWLEYVGLPRTEVQIIDADLSSISAAGDKLLVVQEPAPCMMHLEQQSGYEADMVQRFHFYTVVEGWRYRLPVHLYLVLLRPEADGPDVTGVLEYRWPDGTCYDRFLYTVVRAWEKPVEELLQGGLATLPMAPIARVTPQQLPAIIQRMEERLSQEVPPGIAEDLWAATYLLMGLRYSPELVKRLLQGVRNMKESSTYQAILSEGEAIGEARGVAIGEARGEVRGRIAEARKMILTLGRKRLGELPPNMQASLDAISEVNTLDQILDRILDVETWDELLA